MQVKQRSLFVGPHVRQEVGEQLLHLREFLGCQNAHARIMQGHARQSQRRSFVPFFQTFSLLGVGQVKANPRRMRMHHKKKRPRNRRAGCKLCRPWKINGVRSDHLEGESFGDLRRRYAQSPNDPETVQNWRFSPSRIR